MEAKIGEMAEVVGKHEFSEGVMRQQAEREHELARKELDEVRKQVGAKEKEIGLLK